MNSKKNLAPQKGHKALIAVVLSCVLIAATGTWAWRSYQSLTAENNLTLAGAFDVELHDYFGGVEQVDRSSDLSASGGTSHPQSVTVSGVLNKEEEKKVWMVNPSGSQSPVFVRLQLAETVSGGDTPYNITDQVFEGLDTAAVFNPLLVSWEFGAPIQDMRTWTGATGAFWLMDTSTGYAYWMEALYPGESTDYFLTSITGHGTDENPVDYRITVRGDAISASASADRDQWDDLNNPSAYGPQLDQLFRIYGDMINPATRVFQDINDGTGTGSPDYTAFTTAFPDTAMQEFVRQSVDINKDGNITQEELEAVTSIYNGNTLSGSQVSSLPVNFDPNTIGKPANLDGLEYFPNLKMLYLRGTRSITGDVDLTQLKNLTHVDISSGANGTGGGGSGVTSIDISENSHLVMVNAGDSMSLKSIQLPEVNSQLQYLYLMTNALDSIDLSKQRRLQIMAPGNSSGALTSLDISRTKLGVNVVIDPAHYSGMGLTSVTISQEQNNSANNIKSIFETSTSGNNLGVGKVSVAPY